MAEKTRDTPGVLIFPPLIPLIALGAGLGLDRALPLTYLEGVPLDVLHGTAVGLAIAGALLVASSQIQLKKAGTNINPHLPVIALSTTGIYARVRNPMYVGLFLLYIAITLMLPSQWGLILAIPAILVLHFGVVLREERYLEAKFGDAYRAYKAKTRRYGLL